MRIAVVLALLLALIAWAFVERRELAMHAFAFTASGAPPPLLPAGDEGPDVRWMDDYFTVETVAPGTFAIGEPRYQQQNYSYLIVGETSALLFDAGPGLRDIRSVAEGLTDKPIVFLPSHFHYDHIGNTVTFDTIAVVDLPYLRRRVNDDGLLTFTSMEHLGAAEGVEAPSWQVNHWWPPGHRIDLGGRVLTLLYTPGHTTDSVSLLEETTGLLFSGDYLYPGDLYAFLPNSSMGDYLTAAETLLQVIDEDVRIYGAHRAEPPGAPVLHAGDLTDLQGALLRLRAGELPGEGTWPQRFEVNERLGLLAAPRPLQRW